jgi:hypothetical protein
MFALFGNIFLDNTLPKQGGMDAAPASASSAASASVATAASVNTFKNKFVCFSGRFSEFTRTDAMALVVAKGGKCVDDVSNTIQYLVIGKSPGPVKLSKAQQWRIPTLTEFEFLAFVGADARALKKPSLTHASVTTSVAPLPTVTAASLAAADSSTAFAVPRFAALPPNTLPRIQAQIAAQRSPSFSSLADSTVWTARFAPFMITEQVVSKSDTMLVCLPSSLEAARVDFRTAVRSFVQIAQFALKADAHDSSAVPGYVGMTMTSLRVEKIRVIDRHHVVQGHMMKKGATKKTSHFLGQSILMAVTLADGERWDKFAAIIDHGEKDIYDEGHRTGRFRFCNDVPSLGKTSAKHLEATGASAVLCFYICLQTAQQNVQYLNGEGFYKARNVGSGKGPRTYKVWRCETCGGFILWSALKTCGNPARCSAAGRVANDSRCRKYEEGQESMEDAIMTGQYVLYDRRPDLDRARPIFDDDVLPPPLPPPPLPPPPFAPPQLVPLQQPTPTQLPAPQQSAPPLLSPPPPLPPLLPPPPLHLPQLAPLQQPTPQLAPLQHPTPTQLPPPQQLAPSLPSPLPAISQTQPIGWHLVSESHSADIFIPHDGACHQLGRRHLVAAALKANVPPFAFPFVSRVQLTLTAENEGSLELESVGTNGILVSAGGTSPWETVITGQKRTLVAGDDIAFDLSSRPGTVFELRRGKAPVQWLWSSGHGEQVTWTAYRWNVNATIEQHFSAGEERCAVSTEHYVDFLKMRQVRNDNERLYRLVRRIDERM